MKAIKIFVSLFVSAVIVTLIAIDVLASENTLLPPSLSFQADIYGDTNLETIEYLSDLAFYSWGGFGTNAHIFRSRLLSSGEEIAYAVSASTPNVFAFEIINEAGQRLTIGMPSSAYPTGSVDAVSATELHFVWEINDPNMHIYLHRYAKLVQDVELITGYKIEERFTIENLGVDFTLMRFSEYLHMDDRARLRDFDADTREETVLAINSFTSSGYPIFGKVYLRNEEILSEFVSDGVYATISHQVYQSIHAGDTPLEISKAAYISSTEKSALPAESQIAEDACDILECDSLPTRWYLRSYRTDDASAMFVNGLMVVGTRINSFPDSGWIDVNRYWKQDEVMDEVNYLSLASFDTGVCCASTWGFQLRRDEEVIFDKPGSATYHLGLAYTDIIPINSDGTYDDTYEQDAPSTRLDGIWTIELRVNYGLGFVLVENLPVLGSMKNFTQVRDISDLLGQQENHIHLNIWGEQSGPLEWHFTIRNGDTIVWQNQMTLDNPPRERIHHILLVIDEDGNVYPKLDYPVDYIDKTRGSSINFESTFNNRTTSYFDHELPYQSDDYMLPYFGTSGYNPDGYIECTLPYCYDSHDGYDVDDLCRAGDLSCLNPSAVYPAADGMIIADETGWFETPVGNLLGCQIVIDHGNGWKTIYAHLRVRQPELLPSDPINNICDGITQVNGYVTQFDQIGIIGCSGTGCSGTATHLHFVAYHDVLGTYRVVDPSGWDPQDEPDPWAEYTTGATSYPQWLFRERIVQEVDPTVGGQLLTSNNMLAVAVPAGYYLEPLTFYLTNVPAADPSAHLVNTGISFSLSAWDAEGIQVHQLDQGLEIQVAFEPFHIYDLIPNTLAIYALDEATSTWVKIPTTVDLDNQLASAQVDHLSIFAFMGEAWNRIFLPVITR